MMSSLQVEIQDALKAIQAKLDNQNDLSTCDFETLLLTSLVEEEA
jgi:hypothetical protein